MNKDVYSLVKKFKDKYPSTIAWRLKAHSKVVEKHLNPDEKLLYAFVGQKCLSYADIIHTNVVAITDKRIIVARKRILFGYFCISITPDLFNDLTIGSGIFWGEVVIDTLNEQVTISYISKKSLPEVETAISSNMMKAKMKYKKIGEKH